VDKSPNKSEQRRAELLASVAECCANELARNHGVAEDSAIETGNAISDFLAEYWGGSSFYIPRDFKFIASVRDLEIFERMQRGNAHELATEYGLSYVRIYQIVHKVSAQRKAQRASDDQAKKATSALSTALTGRLPADSTRKSKGKDVHPWSRQ